MTSMSNCPCRALLLSAVRFPPAQYVYRIRRARVLVRGVYLHAQFAGDPGQLGRRGEMQPAVGLVEPHDLRRPHLGHRRGLVPLGLAAVAVADDDPSACVEPCRAAPDERPLFFGAHVVQHVDQQEGVCPGQLRRAQVGVDELDARPPQEALFGRLDLFRIVVHADDPPPLAEHGEHVAQGAVPAPEVYDRRIARHDAVEQLVAPLQPHLDAHVPLQHGALVSVALDKHVTEIGVARPVVGFV